MQKVKIIEKKKDKFGREYALVGRYGSKLPISEDYGINQYIVCAGITYEIKEDKVNDPMYPVALAEWDHGYYFDTDSFEEAKEYYDSHFNE